jgi:hypothetical protein
MTRKIKSKTKGVDQLVIRNMINKVIEKLHRNRQSFVQIIQSFLLNSKIILKTCILYFCIWHSTKPVPQKQGQTWRCVLK